MAMDAAMDVDAIVVISLRESAARLANVAAQLPVGAWTAHVVERHPEGGRRGCYESHAEVLARAAAAGKRRVLVLEDDVRVEAALDEAAKDEAAPDEAAPDEGATARRRWAAAVRVANAALREVEAREPRWTFLLLGMIPFKSGEAEGAARSVSCAFGTHAYVANMRQLQLPLPEYDGRHIDHVLFCDYVCLERPANMEPERFGDNVNILSQLTHRMGGPCSENGARVFASEPLVFGTDQAFDSTINKLHEVGPAVIQAVGLENFVMLSRAGVDVALYALIVLVFVAAACVGVLLARRRPTSRPGLALAATLLLMPLAIAARTWDDTDACAFPCTFMRRWPVMELAAVFAVGVCAAAYATASRAGGRLPALAVLALAVLSTSWLIMLGTHPLSMTHHGFSALVFLAVAALVWLFAGARTALVCVAAGFLGRLLMSAADACETQRVRYLVGTTLLLGAYGGAVWRVAASDLLPSQAAPRRPRSSARTQ